MSNEDPPIALAEVERLLEGHTDRHDERVIVDILRKIDGLELDAVFRRLDLRRLLKSVDDRRLGPKNLSVLFELVTDRLEELSVHARAALIRALQIGRTGERSERVIGDLIMGTRAEALTDLKQVIETAPDHRDLHQLLYRDIDDVERREELLAYIDAQGRELPRRGAKILSDIDDTVYCNWKDARFPKKTVYPGVRQLYRELRDEPGDLVFLSARPGDRAGVVENKTLASLLEKGFAGAVMLAGSIRAVHNNEAIAKRKKQNFAEYQRLWPEFSFVFFGDSGQGDALLAERILEQPGRHGAHAFIHDVVSLDDDARRPFAEVGVGFFDSWLDAAVDCHERDLLDTPGLLRVEEQTESDLRDVQFSDPEQRRAREQDLDRARERIKST